MSAYEPEPDRIWDEYEWERFLQQQDRKTEKYMELLEKYLDHPERDQIIAREMGWAQMAEGEQWNDDEALADEDVFGSAEEDSADASESFEENGLYRAAFSLTIWIDQLFDSNAPLQHE